METKTQVNSKNQKEKHMNASTKWKWAVLAVGIGLFGRGTAHAVDATITVTPNPSLNLTIAPTTYSFGTSVDVALSTVAISSLTITNAGQVSLTVNKAITNQSNPAGWTAAGVGDPTPDLDRYVLYAATSTFHPGEQFTNADHLFNGLNNANALEGVGGSAPTLGISGRVDVWFKLQMPNSVSNSTARTITVAFTGQAL